MRAMIVKIDDCRRVYAVPGTVVHLLPDDGVSQVPLCGYRTFLRWRDMDPADPLDICSACRRELR